MTLFRIAICLLFACFSISCKTPATSEQPEVLQPVYWKNQTITDILRHWTPHIVDSVNGSFFTTLDGEWRESEDSVRFPSMVARHLFSYAAAYLISGEEEHLEMADLLKDFLFQYAWDAEYGGWYDALSPQNRPLRQSKSTFVQVYVITGLSMYYVVTKDEEVLDLINKSNSLLEEKVWDPQMGGYFDNLSRDWSLQNEVKSFSSQLAPVSGYLFYLYMATRDEAYLEQAERILDTVMARMIDGKSGWILEDFDRDWTYQIRKQDENEINIGHNVELAWMLVRAHMLTNRPDYLESGNRLSDSLYRYGFNGDTGIWYAGVSKEKPELHADFTYWWIQAYGNMYSLLMANIDPQGKYLDHFLKGAIRWDESFLDRKGGDTPLSINIHGEVLDPSKANQFKSSYHNVEHGVLNYLYLGSWVNPQPYSLYFRINSSKDGDILYPLPIEIRNAPISKVWINGKDEPFDSSAAGIRLPSLKNARIEVMLNN